MKRLLGLIFLFSGLPFAGWQLYEYLLSQRIADPRYHVRYITQKKNELPVMLLAELLGLSREKPIPIDLVSAKRAEKCLETNFLITKAVVEKLEPDTLRVDVSLRQPIARVGDIEDAAVDRAGILFPLNPFYPPKRLCTLYLGLDTETCCWGARLAGERFEKALAVYDFLSKRAIECGLWAERIDTARAFETSLGRSEIVVHFEEHSHKDLGKSRALLIHRWIVRLPTDGYEKRWRDMRLLCEKLREEHSAQCKEAGRFVFDPRILDLRIADLGFVQ